MLVQSLVEAAVLLLRPVDDTLGDATPVAEAALSELGANSRRHDVARLGDRLPETVVTPFGSNVKI